MSGQKNQFRGRELKRLQKFKTENKLKSLMVEKNLQLRIIFKIEGRKGENNVKEMQPPENLFETSCQKTSIGQE